MYADKTTRYNFKNILEARTVASSSIDSVKYKLILGKKLKKQL